MNIRRSNINDVIQLHWKNYLAEISYCLFSQGEEMSKYQDKRTLIMSKRGGGLKIPWLKDAAYNRSVCDLRSSDVLWGSNLQTIKRLVPFFNLSFKKTWPLFQLLFFVGLTNLSSSLILKRNRTTFKVHCHGQFSSCTSLHCQEKIFNWKMVVREWSSFKWFHNYDHICKSLNNFSFHRVCLKN